MNGFIPFIINKLVLLIREREMLADLKTVRGSDANFTCSLGKINPWIFKLLSSQC